MTTYILHDGAESIDSESNRAFRKRIVEAASPGGVILLVFFASKEEDYERRFTEYQGFFSEYIKQREVRLRLANKDTFIEQAKASDVIVFRGGSTNRLLDTLRSYTVLEDIFAGKVIAGSSAGAYMLSTLNYDKSEQTYRDGLGFVPVKTICHYESTTKENPGSESIEIMNRVRPDLPLIVLRDGEWKEFVI